METVDDLKSDIAKKDVIVKMEQQRIKKQIEEGMFDDAEEILSNPETEAIPSQICTVTVLLKEEAFLIPHPF